MSDSNFIFQNIKRDNVLKDKYYTVIGLEDSLDKDDFPRVHDNDDAKILAKQSIRQDNSIRYSIKIGNNNKIYNPVSIYGQEPENTFLDRVCRSNSKFKDVNAKTFDLYINFLKTKNMAWFHNAEREMG